MAKSPLNQDEIFVSDMIGTGVNADSLDGLDSLSFMRRDETTFPTQNDSYDLGSQDMAWKDLYLSGNLYLTSEASGGVFDHVLKNNEHCIPEETEMYDIGSENFLWKTIYVDNIQANNINNLSTDRLYFTNQSNIPLANNQYTLGNSTYRYSNIHTNNLTCYDDVTCKDGSDIILENGNFSALQGSMILNQGNINITDGYIYVTKGDITLADGVLNGTAATARFADLAEKYTCKEHLNIGEVVCISTDKNYEIEKCDTELCNNVIGVVSENPAFLMNKASDGLPIALTGKVHVQIVGNISKGDPIVSFKNGTARKIKNNDELIYVIGYALEDNDDIESKKVMCIIK